MTDPVTRTAIDRRGAQPRHAGTSLLGLPQQPPATDLPLA